MHATRILIVGAGAQAQVLADLLLLQAEQGRPVEPIGFVDDNPDLAGARFFDLPVRGTIAQIAHIPHDALILGIGNNGRRKQLYEHLSAQGESFARAVHPTAVVARDVIVGPGSYVGPLAVVSVGVTIGANVILNGTATVGHGCTIGDHAHVSAGVTVAGESSVGAGSMVGIGANILPRLRVGAGCVVGAGALVRENVADGTTVVGVPARPLPSGQVSARPGREGK